MSYSPPPFSLPGIELLHFAVAAEQNKPAGVGATTPKWLAQWKLTIPATITPPPGLVLTTLVVMGTLKLDSGAGSVFLSAVVSIDGISIANFGPEISTSAGAFAADASVQFSIALPADRIYVGFVLFGEPDTNTGTFKDIKCYANIPIQSGITLERTI